MEAAVAVGYLRRMLELGVLIDPVLVNSCLRRESMHLKDLAGTIADGMYQRYVHLDLLTNSLEDVPFVSRIAKVCFRHAILSTALDLVQTERGEFTLTVDAINAAYGRVTALISQAGIDHLYYFYLLIAGYDITTALNYHKTVSEGEFLQGTFMHPYDAEDLEIYLLLGLVRGFLRLKPNQDARYIQITRQGQARHQFSRQVLTESGYMRKRMTLSYMYQFDGFVDWEHLVKKVWPDYKQIMADYIGWIGIQPGSHVLQLGSGGNHATFDAGLYQFVQPGGRLMVTDISAERLEALRKKGQSIGASQVEYQLVEMVSLPFADRVFDASVCIDLLHFVDPKRAINELVRTVVPGGIVTATQGTRPDLFRPFFREWFEPLLKLAHKKNIEDLLGYLPVESDLERWFSESGLRNLEMVPIKARWVFADPESAVQNVVRGLALFRNELLALPWDYRKSLINELIERGRDVCSRYSIDERTIITPTYRIKGVRPMRI